MFFQSMLMNKDFELLQVSKVFAMTDMKIELIPH